MRELLVKTKNPEVQKAAKTMGITLIANDESIEVKDKKSEEEAVKLSSKMDTLIVSSPDWTVIPLENLVSRLKGKVKLIAKVKCVEEAKLALEALELGADGVLLETDDVNEIKKTIKLVEGFKERGKLVLKEAVIRTIKPLGLGARSCIDTCALMERGEGMLVGCSSQGMLLVQAEVEENPSVAPRPFRVNAGAASLYVLAHNDKTKYVEEVKAGDEVLLVKKDGSCRPAFVARSKIELRPLTLIEAENDGKFAKAILQTAETVRLVSPNGSLMVTTLKEGDTILAHFQEGGRHFGTLVKEEYCVEK